MPRITGFTITDDSQHCQVHIKGGLSREGRTLAQAPFSSGEAIVVEVLYCRKVVSVAFNSVMKVGDRYTFSNPTAKIDLP
jgi:hypothetical protein